jgi:hypothetical protein
MDFGWSQSRQRTLPEAISFNGLFLEPIPSTVLIHIHTHNWIPGIQCVDRITVSMNQSPPWGFFHKFSSIHICACNHALGTQSLQGITASTSQSPPWFFLHKFSSKDKLVRGIYCMQRIFISTRPILSTGSHLRLSVHIIVYFAYSTCRKYSSQ